MLCRPGGLYLKISKAKLSSGSTGGRLLTPALRLQAPEIQSDPGPEALLQADFIAYGSVGQAGERSPPMTVAASTSDWRGALRGGKSAELQLHTPAFAPAGVA